MPKILNFQIFRESETDGTLHDHAADLVYLTACVVGDVVSNE